MQNKKRGQAALEFLVTYGWAIMGALIVIGALSYFGIFNTQRYINDVCYFGDQFTCEDYIAYQNGSVAVQLRNNFGVLIDINGTTIKSDYGTVNCNLNNIKPNAAAIPPGSIVNITCNVSSTPISLNDKLRYKMILTFERTGSGNLHNQTGDLIITVQKS
ncbi:MAG: hypothetical protein ACP5N1_00780 [Candidatus Woesearchaeota archaeon]